MEKIEIKDNILKFEKKLNKGDTYKVSKSNRFFTISIYKKPQIVQGVASYCDDGKQVIFIDYDNVPRELVERDYSRIQKKFSLPPAYLLSTKEELDGEWFGNYHVICLKKYTANEVYKIISETNCDYNFVSMPLRKRYRNWILRIGPKNRKSKPKFIKILGTNQTIKKTSFEISSAHRLFFDKMYPQIKYPLGVKEDNLKKISLQDYETY